MAENDNCPPSRDPADDGTLAGTLRLVLAKFLQDLDDMLPAEVIAYDRAKNIAQVQAMISVVKTNGQIVTRAQIASVPVLRPGGGGMAQSFNLLPGNLGWLKANDRDISLYRQTWQRSVPNTKRKHKFSDAIFIPDVPTGLTIHDEDLVNALFSTLNATCRIALWADKVKVTAPFMAIGDTEGYTPHTNAILDLQSTTKALQIPRMTHGQRDAIPSPRGGMMVYVTDAPTGFSFYTDGSGWS